MVRQARLTGFEPATVWFVVRSSHPLSYKRNIYKQPSGINFVSSIQCLYHNLSCTQTHCHPFHPFDQKDCSIVVLAVRNLPHLHSIAISPTIPSASFLDAFWVNYPHLEPDGSWSLGFLLKITNVISINRLSRRFPPFLEEIQCLFFFIVQSKPDTLRFLCFLCLLRHCDLSISVHRNQDISTLSQKDPS